MEKSEIKEFCEAFLIVFGAIVLTFAFMYVTVYAVVISWTYILGYPVIALAVFLSKPLWPTIKRDWIDFC